MVKLIYTEEGKNQRGKLFKYRSAAEGYLIRLQSITTITSSEIKEVSN